MSRNLFDLEGQTAVVIGGTGVLGGAMATAPTSFTPSSAVPLRVT
jgi:hypothetical protein